MATNYWRISPGENGKYWHEFEEQEKIKIGWQKVPDARHIQTPEECKKFLIKYNETLPGVFYSFIKEMQIGDIIFISKGITSILRVGKVISEYDYDPLSDYKHYRNVKWLNHEDTDIKILKQFNGSFKRIKNEELLLILENDQIKQILNPNENSPSSYLSNLIESIAIEGYEGKQKELLINHLIRERDKQLTKDYKDKYKSIQKCPACNFNPKEIYSIDAINLFELHHIIPIGMRDKKIGSKTLENDLILLCPNCHRFIHKLMIKEPNGLITLDVLKAQISKPIIT